MVLLVLLSAAISSLVGIPNLHAEEASAVSVDSYQTDISFESYTGYLDDVLTGRKKGILRIRTMTEIGYATEYIELL